MRILALLPVLFACGGKSDTATPTPGTPGGTTTTGSTADTGLPDDPRPLQITFSGDLNETLTFDAPTCSNYPYPAFTNFRAFWRGPHNVVLIAEVLSDFAGPGTYDTDTHNLRVKLQTEAGSTYSFDAFDVDTSQGDSATMTVDWVDAIAHGSFSFTGMHSATGTLTADPATIPIWCDTVEN